MATVHYEVGDIVEVKMGAGVRKIYATAKHTEVKNGEPGLSGILVNENDEQGDDVSTYDHQVVAGAKDENVLQRWLAPSLDGNP